MTTPGLSAGLEAGTIVYGVFEHRKDFLLGLYATYALAEARASRTPGRLDVRPITVWRVPASSRTPAGYALDDCDLCD
jgi:hypothetical protein